MDTISRVIDFWVANGEFLMPVLLTVFVLGISLGIAGLTKDNLMRTVLIVPAALVLYGMGFAAGPFGRELFFNLSAELLTAVAALGILFWYNTVESWAGTLVMVALVAAGLLLFLDPQQPQANLFVNLSTGMIGSFVIVALLRREWAFSPANRDLMLRQSVREASKKRQQQETDLGDFYMLVLGNDEAAISQKDAFLKDSNIEIFNAQPVAFDEETALHYQLVNARIITVVKEQDTVLLANHEARLRLLAYPDTVKRVFKQIQEVLETSELKKLETSDTLMSHVEFKANSPKVLFSDYVEKQIYMLAREWRHGDNEHLIAATDDLLEWAKEMKFIKE